MELKTEISEDKIDFILLREKSRGMFSGMDPVGDDSAKLSFLSQKDTMFVSSHDICDCNEYDLSKEAVVKLRNFLDEWLKGCS